MYALREKKLLVGSDDYGRDLTGVQNLRKKHKRLEAELSSHEPSIQVITCIVYVIYGLLEVRPLFSRNSEEELCQC